MAEFVANEIGVSDDVSAGVGDAALAPLPLNVDIENWPCAASIACIAAGDRAPEPELLDFFEPGWAESEPDIVNGSVPLPKNPVDWVEDDEACDPIDLTTSHAADAAPKAISMFKTSQCRRTRLLPLLPIVSKCRARQKAQQIRPFAHGTGVAKQAIAAAAAGFAALKLRL